MSNYKKVYKKYGIYVDNSEDGPWLITHVSIRSFLRHFSACDFLNVSSFLTLSDSWLKELVELSFRRTIECVVKYVEVKMRTCKGWTDYISICCKKLQRQIKLKSVVAFPIPKMNFFWLKNLNISQTLILEVFFNEYIFSTSKNNDLM